jgi:PKD repeat protein
MRGRNLSLSDFFSMVLRNKIKPVIIIQMELVAMTKRSQNRIPVRPCILLLFLITLTSILPASALPQLPIANFTAVPQEGPALEPVQFTDASTGTLKSPVGIAVVLAAASIVFLCRREKG